MYVCRYIIQYNNNYKIIRVIKYKYNNSYKLFQLTQFGLLSLKLSHVLFIVLVSGHNIPSLCHQFTMSDGSIIMDLADEYLSVSIKLHLHSDVSTYYFE